MVLLRYLLVFGGIMLLVGAVAILLMDVYQIVKSRKDPSGDPPPPPRWHAASTLGACAAAPLLLGLSIAVVPSGSAAVRINQFAGTRPGTLYPGVHWIFPLIEEIELYDIRDEIFTTQAVDDPKKEKQALRVQTREGLMVGLAVALRYRLDPSKLPYINANLPQPLDQEMIAPAVSSALRDIAPGYLVRELFSTKREEIRQAAAARIIAKLGADGIVVKDLVLRDIQLPAEYEKGLEGLLLKEQENERLNIDLEVKQKMVRSAELESDALKAREVKDAEAMAAAKVIDGKAELEKRKLMSEGDEDHIRRVANADAERMRLEAGVLKENPLLIQKIIAEKLSDKVQIMMVPNDGKFFFANDVLKGMQSVSTTPR